MNFVIREIYPTGGHTVTNSSGTPLMFRDEQEAENTAKNLNKQKKDVTRLYVVVPDSIR